MLAEFRIYPLHSDHMSKDVAKVIETLEETGLNFRLGPMGTCVEGELEDILTAIRRCHREIAANHDRVITTIFLDDQKNPTHNLDDMVASVEKHVGHKIPS